MINDSLMASAWRKMGQAGRQVALAQLPSLLPVEAQEILTTALKSEDNHKDSSAELSAT